MNPVANHPVTAYRPPQPDSATKSAHTEHSQSVGPLKAEQNTVTLSAEGKALLTALQEIDQQGQQSEKENKTVGDKVESFAHGALGMDHPDKIKQEEDSSYSAGQYLSAAATIGGIILALA
ncbi:hypothetical protein [Vibrio sp. CAU 1672]|uniref:hypothetical protein n=1 Tax=Vibrio sp. CAU 1672 TaxID=3032594 RepID=UPI0023D9D544|nr:hypothetical protein [Vibrio sp. CAU 1672]MDF2153811.1 hypothetical protein [Vibrio sp. CAU 1672]